MKESENSQKMRALKKCRNAAIVAFIIAAMTAIFSIFRLQNFNPSGVVDALLVFFLGFGILKYRSRVCAVVLFLYFLVIKIVQFTQLLKLLSSGQQNVITFVSAFAIVGIIFLVFLFLGILGTFSYHKNTRINKKNALIKTLVSILYGIITLIIFAFISLLFPNASNDLKALIMAVPTIAMIFLSFIGALPISKNYPMVEQSSQNS